MQNDPSLLKLGGERRDCTFLFTDVRGFTAMSERMDPELVTKIMNEALTIQSDTVKNIMAWWISILGCNDGNI